VLLCQATPADDPPRAESVARILLDHDRAVIRAMSDYLSNRPKATDREQAYFTIFQTAIKNDWFRENQATASAYLNESPQGTARPLARVVIVMAKAQTGDFAGALADFGLLLDGLGPLDEREFVASFAEQLASQAMTAGEVAVARRVYEGVATRFRDDAELRALAQAEIERLALVGAPAPDITVRDLTGRTLRLSDLRGKIVLVDFWATYCVPAVNAMPGLQSAYESLKGRGFEIVSISLDDSVDPVADFAKKHGVTWRQVHNATSGADAVAAFKVRRLPESYLIDPQGRIVRLDVPVEKLPELVEALTSKPTASRPEQRRAR
jgi:peroxiredoxin